MKRLLLAAVAILCASASAQTVNPNQIRPSTTNGQVLTTSGGLTQWLNPSGGSGNVVASPQYRLFIQPNSGTAAVAQGAVAGQNAVAPLLQGQINSDLYQTGGGNNGIANAFGSSDCTYNCNVFVPTNSSTVEHPSIPTGNNRLSFYQGGVDEEFVHNPPSIYMSSTLNGIPSCYGIATGNCKITLFDSTPWGQSSAGSIEHDAFTSPGVNYGNCPNCGNVEWTGANLLGYYAYFNSRGISQMIGMRSVKHAIGDYAAGFYAYGYSDGGQPDYSGEGASGTDTENGETSDYFHGTVGTGGTTGSVSLPILYNSGFSPSSLNRNATSDGSTMLDITQGTISGNVTGAAIAISGIPEVWSLPVSNTISATTTYGNMGCELPVPNPSNPFQSGSVTCNVTGIVGAAYATGHAQLAGPDFPEGVTITAVGSLSGGTQSVTFTYLYPHTEAVTTLWQSTLNDQYISYDQSLVLNGFREPNLHIYGAIDSTHLAVQAFRGAIPPTAYTAPSVIYNLSKSGTTVTATYTPSALANYYVYNDIASAVIAGCSDSNLNGTVTNVTQSIAASTLTWTQSGPGSSCASATIGLPASYSGYHLYPGAEERGPAVSAPGNVPLEPNIVNWTPGDLIEQPHMPFFSSTNIRNVHTINNTLDQRSNTTGEYLQFNGYGISNSYQPVWWRNNNPCNIYAGCGGTMGAVGFLRMTGPNGGAISLDNAPLGNKAVIQIGCAITGCGGPDPIMLAQFLTTNGGNLQYYPTDGYLGSLGGIGYDAKTEKVQGAAINATSGFELNGTAPNGHCLIGNGTLYVDSSSCGSGSSFITSLTTTGSSGPATVSSGVLNIPQYAGGGSMTWPSAAGIAVYAGGSAWGASLTAPAGTIVGTTDTQTLTNKTLDGVTPTTMGYVDPTSSIQGQLNAKAPLASPSFTGTATAVNLTVTGTCTGCGSGSISGLTTGYLPKAASSTSLANSLLDDGVTTANTLTYAGTAGITATMFKGTGTTPSAFSLPAGTGSIPTLPANSAGFAAPATGGTAYLLKLPATATAGVLHAATPATGDGVNESAVTFGQVANSDLVNPATTVNGVTCTLGSTCTVTASGISNIATTVGTTAVAANACSTAVTVTMTGVATTSVFDFTPNADVSGTTGWGTTGGLTIVAWPTSNTLNYKVCNQTASSITPSASVTFNVGAR